MGRMGRQANGLGRGGSKAQTQPRKLVRRKLQVTPDERDRLVKVEIEMREVRSDVKDIKGDIKTLAESLKKLEAIAATGNGGLRTALFIGGILGWVMSFVLGLVAIFRH